tara:strand:+ start:254 stop:898 length:645 start_codon:yes stop_codon:yes gene_type:complete
MNTEVLLFADVLIAGERIRVDNVYWVRVGGKGSEPRVMESGSTVLRPLTESEMTTCWPSNMVMPYRNERVLLNGVGIIPVLVGPLSQRRNVTWRKVNKKWIKHLNETLAYVNGDAFVAPEAQSLIVLPPDFLSTRKRKRRNNEKPASTANSVQKIVEEAYKVALTNHADDMEKSDLWQVQSVDDFLGLTIREMSFAKHLLEFYHLLVQSGRLKR